MRFFSHRLTLAIFLSPPHSRPAAADRRLCSIEAQATLKACAGASETDKGNEIAHIFVGVCA